MAKQSPRQKKIVARVMHEFKHGELESAGGKVRDPKQAIAIGLSEAGTSNRVPPQQNKRNLRRTEKEEKAAGTTRAELYAEAARREVPGRSKMSKQQLMQALSR